MAENKIKKYNSQKKTYATTNAEQRIECAKRKLDPQYHKKYSENEVIQILKDYTEVIEAIMWARGLGVDKHDPSLHVLERLKDVKEKADKLPLELRVVFVGHFKELERQIKFCQDEHGDLEATIPLSCRARGYVRF